MDERIKAHMALTDEQRYALVEEHLGLKKHRDDLVIDPRTGRYTDAARYFDLIDAAIALQAEQAGPSDAKDAARYRYLVVMETKAAPDTVAHYIRNPEHLDRVIEVMKQKP